MTFKHGKMNGNSEYRIRNVVHLEMGCETVTFESFINFMKFLKYSSIIFESFSESFIKENKYSNINDKLVKHYTALLMKLMKMYLQERKYETFIESFTT